VQEAEPLLQLSDVATEFVGFVAFFLSAGAVGFRYSALGARFSDTARAEQGVWANAAQRAAMLGLVGAIVQAVFLFRRLSGTASAKHLTLMQAATANPTSTAGTVLLVVAIVGLALAASRQRIGWPLAALGVVGGALSGVLGGQWARLVNPVHELVAGLWIGSLLMLVVAGLATLFADSSTRDRRGSMAADMVNGFSPLALSCGVLLVLSGLITAWKHLNPLSSLWTTPYGYALIVKLALAATVFALGAWNWKRQRPSLGTEGGAMAIRRSSTYELTAATLVLVATAVVVSLPSPRPPKPAGAPGGPPGAEGAPAGATTSPPGAADDDHAPAGVPAAGAGGVTPAVPPAAR
jgi:putative copper export protein